MIQIETDDSAPSARKLFTLSAIYGVPLNTLMSLYVNVDGPRHHMALGNPKTHLVHFGVEEESQPLVFPIRFDPAFNADETNLLSRMVEDWKALPAALLRGFKLRDANYALIGLEDRTMFPLIPPGSLVQIEEEKIMPEPAYTSEFDRPIWFLELRDGYVCSWCEFDKPGRVVCVPHYLSGRKTREFAFPRQAEVVGRVTSIAARLIRYDPADAAPKRAEQSAPT